MQKYKDTEKRAVFSCIYVNRAIHKRKRPAEERIKERKHVLTKAMQIRPKKTDKEKKSSQEQRTQQRGKHENE